MGDKECSVVNCQKPVKKGEYIVVDGDIFCKRCAHLLLEEERNFFKIISLTRELTKTSKG